MKTNMHLRDARKTALIDAELVLYKCAAKAESEGTGIDRLTQMCMMALDNIVSGCKASNYYYVVSGRDNFRKTLYDDYKAGRPPKPSLYNQLCENIKEYAGKRWVFHPQLEADDLLGIMATNGRVPNPIICSIDKDMLGVPGWHYNWNKDDFPKLVTQEEADHQWLAQLLKGDPTDNIQGIEGIGDVKAEKLIKKYKSAMDLMDVPSMATYIYAQEKINLDHYYKCLYLVSIWRAPMPKALLDNELIASIAKTIDSLN